MIFLCVRYCDVKYNFYFFKKYITIIYFRFIFIFEINTLKLIKKLKIINLIFSKIKCINTSKIIRIHKKGH